MVKERILHRKRKKYYPLYPYEDLLPDADGTRDLGSSSLQYEDAYINGILYADGLRMEVDGRMLHASSPSASGGGSFYIKPGDPPIFFVYASGATSYVWASKVMGSG